METNREFNSMKQPPAKAWGLALPLFIRPRSTLEEINRQTRSIWATPLLILTVIAIVFAFIASPIRKQLVQTGGNLPPQFQYYSQEDQQKFLAAQETRSSGIFTLGFPLAGQIIGIWLSWFLFGSVLHLTLTLAGSRSSNLSALNLAAWSMLPLGLRYIVQMIYMLSTRQLVAGAGLSGLITSETNGVVAFFREVVGSIDLFFIWQAALLWLGASLLGRLPRGRTAAAVGITIIILLVLMAVPGFLAGKLSGLSTGSPFFYF